MTSEGLAADPHLRKRVGALDSKMSYVDVGDGDLIVFLQGNPTSSPVWRNIMPSWRERGVVFAPDRHGGPSNAYRFVDHDRRLDAWFEALKLKSKVILVVHDWGRRWDSIGHRDFRASAWDCSYAGQSIQPRLWSDSSRGAGRDVPRAASRKGERVALCENIFVEGVPPKNVIRHSATKG